MLRAAIVVITHNRPTLLHRTLSSLQACAFPSSIDEIVVIENGLPNCGSADLCSQTRLPWPIAWRHFPDRRKPAALNFALTSIQSELVCFFDDDVRLDAGCLTAYVAAAQRHGRHNFFGGPHDTEGGGKPPEWLKEYLPPSAYPNSYGDVEKVVRLTPGKTIFMGFNWAAFKEDMFAVGGFAEYLPEGISSAGEETLMQRRLMLSGTRAVYVPQATVWHFVPDHQCSYGFALERMRFFGRNSTIFDFMENGRDVPTLPPKWLFKRIAHLQLRHLFDRIRGLPKRDTLAIDSDLALAMGTLDAYRMLRKTRHKATASPEGNADRSD